MPKRTVLYDKNNNELECYINQDNKVYIGVGPNNDNMQFGYIALDKEDVRELIKMLSDLEKEMEEE
ncbi:hypothetical protein ACMGDK_12050 [Chryseobacterium sp. DT-3]|uniref:hypothetical protein n=1 Tax=Chryseobacterium sp. DT-3 TaxID=3396164 RepID=UPI003F19640A